MPGRTGRRASNCPAGHRSWHPTRAQARTYTNPDKCQSVRPSGATAKQPDDHDDGERGSGTPRAGADERRLTGTYRLDKGGTWQKTG
ncbi:hypothetical protein GKQ77_16565 [Streptomyces sp. BG9H]|uniref:Uncharacterized protein n=1 Tax=Streptomyces anatolicus TaxID=2675858 RepID=A0ABS6YP29_9ACTN|nr:hypothetical protein [Streptomyces anatolicus]MBW5423160.1 hypothetical protein [Streptomyces anatolicus]